MQNSTNKMKQSEIHFFIREKMLTILAEILRLKNGAKECIVQISARAFQRVFTCKNRRRYSRERAPRSLGENSIHYSFAKIGVDTAENEPPKVWRCSNQFLFIRLLRYVPSFKMVIHVMVLEFFVIALRFAQPPSSSWFCTSLMTLWQKCLMSLEWCKT